MSSPSVLLSSVHLEAVEGMELACDPPLPAGCITREQRLANWATLTGALNKLWGTAFAPPTGD